MPQRSDTEDSRSWGCGRPSLPGLGTPSWDKDHVSRVDTTPLSLRHVLL